MATLVQLMDYIVAAIYLVILLIIVAIFTRFMQFISLFDTSKIGSLSPNLLQQKLCHHLLEFIIGDLQYQGPCVAVIGDLACRDLMPGGPCVTEELAFGRKCAEILYLGTPHPSLLSPVLQSNTFYVPQNVKK